MIARRAKAFVKDARPINRPAGNRLEAFHGAQIADATFKPSRDVSGFRTGPQGMGHTLLTAGA